MSRSLPPSTKKTSPTPSNSSVSTLKKTGLSAWEYFVSITQENFDSVKDQFVQFSALEEQCLQYESPQAFHSSLDFDMSLNQCVTLFDRIHEQADINVLFDAASRDDDALLKPRANPSSPTNSLLPRTVANAQDGGLIVKTPDGKEKTEKSSSSHRHRRSSSSSAHIQKPTLLQLILHQLTVKRPVCLSRSQRSELHAMFQGLSIYEREPTMRRLEVALMDAILIEGEFTRDELGVDCVHDSQIFTELDCILESLNRFEVFRICSQYTRVVMLESPSTTVMKIPNSDVQFINPIGHVGKVTTHAAVVVGIGPVAIKCMKELCWSGKTKFLRELSEQITIVRIYPHSFVDLRGYISLPGSDGGFGIVQELCLGSLWDFLHGCNIGSISLPTVGAMILQIGSAIASLHSCGSYHGFLSATNVLISNASAYVTGYTLKLSGMHGLSSGSLDDGRNSSSTVYSVCAANPRKKRSSRSSSGGALGNKNYDIFPTRIGCNLPTICNSSRYLSPEAVCELNQEGHMLRCTQQRDVSFWQKADVYAFGVLIVQIVTKKEPFWGMNIDQIHAHLRAGFHPRIGVEFAEYRELQKLVDNMCAFGSEHRPSISEVCKKLSEIFSDEEEEEWEPGCEL